MIRKYIDKDFEQIKLIAQNCWKNEMEMDEELSDFIYDFLVRYYLINKDLVYVYDDHSEIKAFLIASLYKDTNEILDYWNKNVGFLKQDNQEKAELYLKHLNYNHKKVKNFMNNDSLSIGLIASIKPYAGTQLINQLKKEGSKYNFKDVYL